jgi:hypothetical protein
MTDIMDDYKIANAKGLSLPYVYMHYAFGELQKARRDVINLTDQIDMIIKTAERMAVRPELSQPQRDALAGFVAGIKDSLKDENRKRL